MRHALRKRIGGLILLEHKVQVVNAASVTFSGLDGNADGVYLLQGKILNSSASFATYLLKPNGGTSNLHGMNNYQNTSSVWAGLGSGTQLCVGFANAAASWFTTKIMIYARKNAHSIPAPMVIHGEAFSYDGAEWVQLFGGQWTDTTTNLTSIELNTSGSVANSFGDGSEFWLYTFAQ